MRIACCIWALSGAETDQMRDARELGFDWIDIQPGNLRTLESRLLAQELGLRVSCLGATFGMPPGASLDSADPSTRETAIAHCLSALDHAHEVAAQLAYVVPGQDRSEAGLTRYGEALWRLAERAAQLDIKLAVEHFPGKALPTADETLAYISALGHPNLYLLYDSGHILLSGEDPATVIFNADDRLGYVHVDDNDGMGDLHWGLLDGVMTEEALDDTLRALRDIGYAGALSLELSPRLPKPGQALQDSRDMLLRALHRAAWD
ncbi:MAG: sugar phosphate isomerase/epimerase [Chloroflexi bacterium]|nr:sugar phosphate isomerase/epimerase [Chloroflexota bacterium]MCY4248360.1 sugar phosphate isomerase/epimerase [Chloroflexota bacterium]